MTEREYAQHRGCSRSTVQHARRSGRLSRSVTRGPRGELRIDPIVADAEWAATTRVERVPLSGRTAPRPASKAELAAVAKRLSTAMRAWIGYLADTVAHQAPDVVEGARAALQEAGRPATAAALTAELELDDPDDSDPVAIVAERLLFALGDMDRDPAASARAAGRAAVLGERKTEVRDDDEG